MTKVEKMDEWLNPEDIHEILYRLDQTIVIDVDGVQRFRLFGSVSELMIKDIIQICNGVWRQGVLHGRAEKAREIRQALREGED